MADSLEEIKERTPFIVTIQPYVTHADHSSDAFWYSRVTASDLAYFTLKFDPSRWRGTFVVGVNKNSSWAEFLSVSIIKEIDISTEEIIQAFVGSKYRATATRGNKFSYDVFLTPNSPPPVDDEP